MTIELTPAEREFAKRYITRRERFRRRWPVTRLFLLFVALLALGFGALFAALAVQSEREVASPGRLLAESTTIADVAFDVYSRSQAAMGTAVMYALALICVAAGAVLLATTLAAWNRHLSTAIIIKVLCANLEGVAETGE